ncbi:MAG: methyltransferase domain-containing protein [Rhodospirillales bacterium]|nr:methyltransferase domain-containing protein [Rhodospirillales bacterium]
MVISAADGQGAESHAEGLGTRKVALHLLSQVLDRKQPLDQLLEGDAAFHSLVTRDRAFVRMMVATTLRRLGQIDNLIARATDRPEPPQPPSLYNLLRLGVVQIVFMAVPDYAVVDTCVELAGQTGMSRQKGLVNAVLRRVTKDAQEWLSKQDETRLNTPDWLMAQWVADYGLRTAAEIGLAHLSEAPLDISIKNPGMREYWAGTLGASLLPTGTLRMPAKGMVYELPGYDDGMWWVQDASAALPAKLFGDVTDKSVIDLCAAPGGKTAQLAAMGAHVTALDRSVNRLKRLHENMRRLRLEDHVTVEAADGAVWQPREKADFVLLDAPCTATGTIRRHPDVLHLKAPSDMDRLCETQARILENAVSMLAPGGILVYCTCSLQKAEGEAQIERLLASGAPVRRKPVAPAEIGDIEALITAEGDVRVLPFHLAPHGGMDGFYICRLIRV